MIKDDIYNLIISSHPKAISFTDLEEKIKGFSGNTWFGWPDQNVFCWCWCSEDAVKALTELQRDGKIEPHSVGMITILWSNTKIPALPLAKNLNHSYKDPHYMPVIFLLAK